MNHTLAQVARSEARKNYHGDTSAAIGNLQTLVDCFPDEQDVSVETLDQNWSGAFAYLCVKLAGIKLVPHYPDPRIGGSFAWSDCWVRYARLPKIRLWHGADEEPEIGDLVAFQPEEKMTLQIGIVLSVSEDVLETAEGNYHNHSAIVERKRDSRIFGYIRLK